MQREVPPAVHSASVRSVSRAEASLSQHRDSKSLTKAQIEQHKQLGSQIQRANAFAAQALLTLRRFRPGHKRCEHIYSGLANVVRRMNFLVGCCEQIATSGFQPQITRISVILGTTCEHCEETGRSADRSSGPGYMRTLEADPAWCVLLDYLLLQVSLTIGRAVAGECSPFGESEDPPRCLSDLTKALLRQHRHLTRMGSVRVPEIVIIYDDAEVCSECGNPYTSGPPADDEEPVLSETELT